MKKGGKMKDKECQHRFKTVKKGEVYECRKCGQMHFIKRGIKVDKEFNKEITSA